MGAREVINTSATPWVPEQGLALPLLSAHNAWALRLARVSLPGCSQFTAIFPLVTEAREVAGCVCSPHPSADRL